MEEPLRLCVLQMNTRSDKSCRMHILCWLVQRILGNKGVQSQTTWGWPRQKETVMPRALPMPHSLCHSYPLSCCWHHVLSPCSAHIKLKKRKKKLWSKGSCGQIPSSESVKVRALKFIWSGYFKPEWPTSCSILDMVLWLCFGPLFCHQVGLGLMSFSI